ncbi:MAG: hypothetical protein WCI05_10360 [Myxococcales bacterium]|jgi:hypothetical protein
MDLAHLIEGKRFLGREFLVWLWYESEQRDGRFVLGDGSVLDLALEGAITLDAGPKAKEQSKLRGMAPSATPEAREALRQGKLPAFAKLRVERGENVFSFAFSADRFALSGIRIPAVVKDESEERFFERMVLLEQIEGLITALYREFLLLRTSDAWQTQGVTAVERWSGDEGQSSGRVTEPPRRKRAAA